MLGFCVNQFVTYLLTSPRISVWTKYKQAFVFIALFRPARADLVILPEDLVVRTSQTAVLRCGPRQAPPISRILWFEFAMTPTGSVISDNRIILQHPHAARYSIIGDETNNEFFLEIRNVSAVDTGTYSCMNVNSGPPEIYEGYAELTVLGETQL